MKKSILSVLAVAGLTAAAIGHAGGLPLYYGETADAQDAERTIVIKPDAKWVNVTSGETVKFVDADSGRSFAWRFDAPGPEVFDLVAVAPPGVISKQHLTAYVAQDPFDHDD